jgi:hypothetical protein
MIKSQINHKFSKINFSYFQKKYFENENLWLLSLKW